MDTSTITRRESGDEEAKSNQQCPNGFNIASSSCRNSGNTTGISRNSLPDGPKTSPRPKLTDDRLENFVIVPEYKLIFCYAEKVGCSMFNHLFRMLRIHHPAVASDPELLQFQAEHNWYINNPQALAIEKPELENMLADPSWTKAVFYRDPLARFLSAFRSKCEPGSDGESLCEELFGIPDMTFDEVVDYVGRFGLSDENHFAPVSDFCGGIGTTIDYYDVVHELDAGSAPRNVAALFDKIGVGEETTQSLVERIVRSGGTDLDEDIEYVAQLGAELGYGVTQKKSHLTSAKKHVCDYYNTKEKVELIEKLYSTDYDTFRFSPRQLNCTH